MNKIKIYSLPKYDFSTDTFSDGPLPKDADAYFSKDKSAQNYYAEWFLLRWDDTYSFAWIRESNGLLFD